MDLLGDKNFKTQEQEQNLLPCNEQFFDDYVRKEIPLTIENIAFDRTPYQNINKQIFLEMIQDLLSPSDQNKVQKAISEYLKRKIDEDALFAEFQKSFGKYLVYKYFYVFTQSMSRSNVYERLFFQVNRRLQQLKFSKENLLSVSNSWEDLFTTATRFFREQAFLQIFQR